MKRLKLKINRGLKAALLCAGLLGGSMAAKSLQTEKTIKIAFTIGLVASFKKIAEEKGEELSDDDVNFLKGMEKSLVAAFKAHKDGVLTSEEFDAKVDAKISEAVSKLSVADAKVGEKAIKDILTTLGEDITALKTSGLLGKEKQNKFIELLNGKMPDIEKMFKSKSGSITISLKAADIMDRDNTLDSSAISDNDITENFRVDAFIPKRQDKQFIYDIASRTTATEVPEVIIWHEEGDEEGAIAEVEEGAVKPLVSLKLVKNKSEAKKAAGKVIITEEFQKFRKRVYQIVMTLFNQKVNRDYQNILTGDLVDAASAYIGTDLDGTIVNPTDYDAMGAVCCQLEELKFMPTHLVIRPTDKWRMALTKDANGQYMVNVIAVGADGVERIFGLQVITTTHASLAPGEAIICEGNLWQIEEEAVEMRIGYGISVEGETITSDFDTNRLRVIGELFFHDYIASINDGSVVKFSFAAVKEALEAEAVVMG